MANSKRPGGGSFAPWRGPGRPPTLRTNSRFSSDIQPAIGPIAYRDSSFVATGVSATSHIIVIPATVQVGDGMLLIVVSGAGVTENLTTPTGWTLVATRSKSANIASALYKRVAQAGDAGSNVTLTGDIAGGARRAGIILAYSGIDSAIVDVEIDAEETVAGLTHVTPAMIVANSLDWEIQIVADRASPGSTTITPPDILSLRQTAANTGSGAPTVAAADTNRVFVLPGMGGDTWTGTISTANAVMWTIALRPFQASVSFEGWGMPL